VRRVETPFVFGRNPSHQPPTDRIGRLWWKVRTYAEWFLVAHDWSWNWGVAAAKVLEALPDSEQSYDALVLDAPPRPATVPIVRWAKRRGIPILLDLRDAWAWDEEVMPARFDLRPKSRRLRWELPLREEAVTGAKHVVLTSPDLVRLMRERFPALPPAHFSSIPNAFMAVDTEAVDTDRDKSGQLRIAYTGSLAYGRLHQTMRVVRAMAETRRRGGPDFRLVVAGSEGESLLETAAEEGIADHVEVLGWISREDAIRVQREADVLLLLQPPQMGAREAIPAKLFEYMERRRNILGLVGASPSARIIREHGLGVAAIDEHPESLVAALLEVAERATEHPFLPAPPDVYSERATVEEFAQRLDRVLAGFVEAV